jgi:phosphoribosylformimino-5-aminoimidazole carboxamide ribotide isomerase
LASTFDLLPAIDLRAGRVVRLRQGDFTRETAYSDDPVAVARGFVDGGARWLHVVDLDGARSGVPAHGDVVRAIIAAVGDRAAVEVAGGLRDETAVDAILDAGAGRVVVGTAALRDPAFAGRLVERHGAKRVVAAVDVRDDQAVGEGWAVDAAGHDAETAMRRLADAGIGTFEVTAVARDGLGTGPDLDLYRRLVALDLGAIVASAGITSLDDLAAVRTIGCCGAIVGRALYDGSLELGAAIRSLG